MKLRLLFLVLLQSLIHCMLHAQSVPYIIDSLNEKAFAAKRLHKAEALQMLSTAESLAAKYHYQHGLAVAYLYEGGVFQQSGFSKKALAFFYQSLAVSKGINDTFNIARANQQIAMVLNENGEPDAAETLLRQSLHAYALLKKTKDVVNVCNSLGLVYLNRKKYTEAAQLFDSAFHASQRMAYTYGTRKALFNQGLLYMAQRQHTKARTVFEQSRAMSQEMRDAYGTASCDIQLARIAGIQGNRAHWIAHANQAFEAAAAIGAMQLQRDAIAQLTTAYKQSNDKDLLIQWQERMISIQQKLHDTDKASTIEFIGIFKKQEFTNQAALQKVAHVEHVSHNQRLLLLVVCVLLVMLLLTCIPIYFNYKKVRMYSSALAQKNTIIEKNATSLDLLNKAISRQNQRLEEENQMKDKLLSIISHDLRHPLVNTKSILDLINLKLVSQEETETLLEQLEGQYVHSLTLLDNLLFWIRARMKGVKVGRTCISMHQMINGLIEEHRVQQQHKQIEVCNRIDEGLKWLAEKEMLKIVFRNLLSNALKFTPPGGKIFFSSVMNEACASILVRDTGVGISREVLKKIDRSEYFSTKGTANEKGSGFGLVLVKELLCRHNAELVIESEPGKGSCFTVKFRYCEQE